MTVAELDTKPLLKARGLKMHFPVTDLTRTMRPHPAKRAAAAASRSAAGIATTAGMCAKFCWISCSIHLPGLDPGSRSQWLEMGQNRPLPQVCPDGTSHHQNRW